MSHLFVVDVETKKVRRADERRVHRRPLRLVARQPSDRVRSPHQRRSGEQRLRRHLGRRRGRRRRAQARDPGRPDSNPQWSPDGSRIAFETSMASPKFFYTNRRIATIPAAGGPIVNLSAQFDEDPSIVRWTPAGIFFSASARTWAYLYRLDPATKAVTRLAPADRWIGSGFSLSADAQTVAFMASDAATFPEVYRRADERPWRREKLTTTGEQVAAWPSAPIEVVSWPSQDGATIEGILHKPVGFQAGKRTRCSSSSTAADGYLARDALQQHGIYPIDVWVTKGALVLEPNYRGSAGYGEKFRSLNYPEPRRRRRLGRAVRRRLPRQGGAGRCQPRRRNGLEPGRLHLGVPDHPRQRPVQGRSRSAPASRTG